ncbi:MAG: hypothetical protein J0M12_03395 [Deltaproteobacteria bacterium]|nr:hypothetical protein [Deltaproteobacteria bacterium]
MELIIEKARDPKLESELRALWLGGEGRLDRFIDRWVGGTRKVMLSTGWDDRDPGKRRAYIIVSEGAEELAEAYLRIEDIESLIPEIDEYIPPAMRRDAAFQDEPDEQEEKFFEKRDRLLEAEWSEEFYETTFRLENAVKLALGYVLTTHGEVTFDPPTEMLFEQIEEPSTSPDAVIEVRARQIDEASRSCRKENLIAIRATAAQ